MGQLEKSDACGLVCVCLLYRCPATLLFCVLLPFISPPKQTDLLDRRRWAVVRQHPPTSTLRVSAALSVEVPVERREARTTQDLAVSEPL